MQFTIFFYMAMANTLLITIQSGIVDSSGWVKFADDGQAQLHTAKNSVACRLRSI